jgi:hypothetical protein
MLIGVFCQITVVIAIFPTLRAMFINTGRRFHPPQPAAGLILPPRTQGGPADWPTLGFKPERRCRVAGFGDTAKKTHHP